MASLGNSFDVESFKSLLSCPVDFQPLRQAVNLHPCCHKINQAVAERLFGHANGASCTKQNQPCPVCRQIVITYARDFTIRDIVLRCFPSEDLILEPRVRVVREEVKAVAYPGIRGHFVHDEGDWSLLYNGSRNLCKEMTFESITNNSLINGFSLFGYKDGSISLHIKFSGQHAQFRDFLRQYGVVMDTYSDFYYGSFGIKTTKQLQDLFAILSDNNEIPAPYYEQIKKIIEGHCESL